ncbi:CAP domain-containing protein [Baia soyae]|uniref:Putative YkwD family protein n=1 Tax=Baia soyae TaxID=1544746 RepID=A0A4R2S230_9BACL|nr:CAP domain-containing protein [Baia soyae]TCP69696.1 putative YkwD family protein [Baia soyae]
MRRILPIVTSILIFSFVIVACTSAADSGGNKTPAASTDTSQTAPVPTETASSLSTNSSDPTKNEASSKEEEKSNNTAESNQKEKNAKPTNSPTTPKAPTTPEKSKAPTKPTAGATTPSNSALSSAENEVVRLVNIERQKAGLKPLVADTKISSVARVKSQDMIDNRYFNHQSPRYGSPFDMMSHFGIRYQTAGENIAAGQPTPAEVMKSWMNSPGHRANILSSNFTKIGVGFVKGGSYGMYWTQQFAG